MQAFVEHTIKHRTNELLKSGNYLFNLVIYRNDFVINCYMK